MAVIKQKYGEDIKIENVRSDGGIIGKAIKQIIPNKYSPTVIVESDAIPALCAELMGMDNETATSAIRRCPICGKGLLGGTCRELFIYTCGHKFVEVDADRPAQDEEQGDICEICKQSIKGIKELCKKEHPVSDGPECGDELITKEKFLDSDAHDKYHPNVKLGGCRYGKTEKSTYGPEFEFDYMGGHHKIVDTGDEYKFYKWIVTCDRWAESTEDVIEKDLIGRVIEFITARLSYRKKEVWEKV